MSERAMPRVTPWFMKRFTAYSRWCVRRRFHAVRLLKASATTFDSARRRIDDRSLVVFLNHASWWDPLVSLLVADSHFRARTCFAPIAAAHLDRYRFFRHLGFYGVSERSALSFVRTTCALLDQPQNAVWVTPQGRFADVRERPLRFAPGLAAVAKLRPHSAYMPLAIEYTFWIEPQPEILVAFGEPIIPAEQSDVQDWTAAFERSLAAAQDALASASARREPAEWQALEEGARGVNPIYDGWRWLRARLHGEDFSRGHHVEAVK